ncbi:uncharacterized protein BDV17DRAFT_225956 [Aspergillus undulatus]|uniref:uncharacterized protein n=1 Tax=Aspergillus undulatus TaxID=1810928 RepID=UPI003CCC913A
MNKEINESMSRTKQSTEWYADRCQVAKSYSVSSVEAPSPELRWTQLAQEKLDCHHANSVGLSPSPPAYRELFSLSSQPPILPQPDRPTPRVLSSTPLSRLCSAALFLCSSLLSIFLRLDLTCRRHVPPSLSDAFLLSLQPPSSPHFDLTHCPGTGFLYIYTYTLAITRGFHRSFQLRTDRDSREMMPTCHLDS